MIDHRQQFRVLYRNFVVRLVDLELLSADGDIQKLFVQFAALLGAFSVVVAIFVVPRYAFSNLPVDKLALAAVGDQQFLISTTMVVVGMFGVLAWNAVFPDRRDCFVLSTLPVRTRTMFLAKVAAIASGLGISIAAVNFASGLAYPFVAIPPDTGMLGGFRTFGAYGITMAAAGTFVFCSLLALQGIAAQFLSYRLFLRVSSFLQIAAFFLVLAVYFLTPGGSELSFTAPENQRLLSRFPSFWFLGLFQELNGSIHPMFAPLAARALLGLSIVITVAVTTYALVYFRNIRRIIEQPDIVPADRRRPAARFGTFVYSKFLSKPLERAIFLFAARTLARSRQHRAILAVYFGIGLAISLAYAKVLLYGHSNIWGTLGRYITVPQWHQPNVPFMAAGFVMLSLVVIGTRAVFSLPAAAKANWTFRVTAVYSPRAYFSAVRKALYGLAAIPVWIVSAMLYFAIWPPAPVFDHLIVLALVGIILTERSLYEFRKIPFACSYLPGRSDLKRKLAIYGTLFLLLTDLGTRYEFWALRGRSRYIVLLAILLAMAVRARSRWTAFAAAPYHRIQFEDLEPAEVTPLDLRRDGAWGTERYIDVVNPEPERSWQARIKSAAIKAAIAVPALMVTGAAYEQYAAWRQDRDRGPRIGQSVDIGGRSLNISCSGEGGPVVIFESGAGGPGCAWSFVQREVSQFARACWYDRAGYGWSDAGPYPRDAAAIATDLHRLLSAAAIASPYVLVGASFGGFSVRVFNELYADDVAGMVLVDSSHVDEREPIPPPGEWNLPDSFYYARSVFAQVIKRLGILRVLMDHDLGPPPKGITPEEWRISNSFEPRTLAENAKELFLNSARQARAGRGMNGPLVVLTAGLPPPGASNPVEARQFLARQKRWIEIQSQLTRFSLRGRQMVVENSRHGIQYDAPEAVIGAIREVVTEIREGTQ